MIHPPDLVRIPASGWSKAERLGLLALVLVLAGLFWARVETRRQDGARTPLSADVVMIHIAGLRADALPSDSLASEAGLDPDRVLTWSDSFAPSGDARRSLLSVLRGDMVLNLDHAPGPESLPSVLGAAGWATTLIVEGQPPGRAGAEFGEVIPAGARAEVPELVAEVISTAPDSPIFLFVHIGSSGTHLHATTTNATQLLEEYKARIKELRGLVARIGQGLTPRKRPRYLALAGASGLELGAHPNFPNRPWDDHLKVPMVLGLQQGDGLPFGRHTAMVQTSDLAPTLLDLLDLRRPAQRDEAESARTGRSLEALVHGWERPPIHDELFFADVGHVAVRTPSWKLITPVSAPWRLHSESAMLYALGEDPAEQFDLVQSRRLGLAGRDLMERLRAQLARPETVGGAP